MTSSEMKFGGAIFALAMLAAHLYFYELTWVYTTPDGSCVAVARHNELRSCGGDVAKLHQTAIVPYGTTIDNVWK